MIISYLGGECVKVQFGDIVLAFNPPSRDSKLRPARFGADVALSTIHHPDCNGVDTLGHGGRQPFIISGPGEYEIKEVVVRGFPTESKYGLPAPGTARQAGGETKVNTIYLVTLEGMRICFLGALSAPELPAEVKEALDDIDVLFVPVGGNGVLSAAAANKLAVSLEPRLVIPIHFNGLAEGNVLKQFLKEAGEEKSPPQEKLTLKKRDLEGKEGEIIVLKTGQ